MSRLGREYLQVGQYTELIFPSYGVRFIAVNDGVDSLYESTNDFTPFRNLMNEFYAKDCSKKGRSVVRLKAETGARVSSRPRYGYMKDPADPKRHMVPDPETAPVVRYIFDLCVSGKGPSQIAKQLKKDKVPSPGYSYYQKHGVELTGVEITQPYNWSTNTVAGILEDETYLGHTINLKSTTLSFKNKKRIERPESEQLRFENTHEALVTQQTWELVQDIRKHKRRRANMAEQNIFSGLVYCLDCGGTMVLHRAHTMDAVKNNFMCIIRLSAKGTAGVMKPVGVRTLLEFVILSTERSVYYRTRGGEWWGCIAATSHVYMVRSSVKASTIGANK